MRMPMSDKKSIAKPSLAVNQAGAMSHVDIFFSNTGTKKGQGGR